MNKNKLTYDEALKNALKYFNGDDLAASVFISKYAISDEENNYLESTPDEMHYRMAKEFARIEEKMGGDTKLSEQEIYSLFNDWTIIPGGSVMNGLGNPNYIGSLSNCFVAQPPMDSYSSIMKNREIMVQLMKRRGGVGIDISNLRPSGAKVSNAAKTSTGAVSFMNVYSELTKEVALCIEGTQRVLTPSGMKQIKDIVVGDFVWTRVGFVKVVNTFDNGIRSVYKTKTKFGYEIETTDDHVFLTCNNNDLVEKKISDFVVDEPICMLNGCNIDGEEKILTQDYFKSMEYVGEKHVYDIELETEHLFWCEGFYVHNCGRRGALMISMSSKHPDIDEFIKVKQDLTKITGANISVKFDDEFMEAVLNDSYYIQRFPIETNIKDIDENLLPLNQKIYDGEKCYKKVKAKDIWDEFVTCSWKTAEPGIMYEDKHLKYSPDSVYEQYKGITTNPCITGDAMIITNKGEISLKELVERFNNGEEFDTLSFDIENNKREYNRVTNALLTRKNAEIIKITALSSDFEIYDIKLTPDHKIYIIEKGWVEAENIEVDDELLLSYNGLECVFVSNIEKVQNEDVYDITVEKNHNFFANDILVHNCGEIFMDPNNSCRLMHINLANFVINPFTENAYFDYDRLEKVSSNNMRLCDDLVELELEYVSRIIDKIKLSYTEENETELKLWETIKDKGEKSRRAGCGATGLADAIAMLNIKLGSDESYDVIDKIFKTKMLGELKTQSLLAKERGCFDGYDFNKEFTLLKDNNYLGNNLFFEFIVNNFNEEIENIRKYGRRNVSWSTMAPVGSVSILTQTTSGIEPLFSPFYKRRKKISSNNDRVDFIDNTGEKFTEYFVIHKPFKDWIINFSGYFNENDKANAEYIFNNEMTEEILNRLFEKSPWGKATASEITANQHIHIQRIGQKYTTHSISKTINLPETATIEEVSDLYIRGWVAGLKGLTIYRDNCRAGIMVKSEKECDCKKTTLLHNAPKRPKIMTCDIKRFRNGGEKWIAAIGLMDGKPYEIFTGLAEKLNIPEYITKAEIIKTKINKMVEDDETGEMVEKKVSRYDIRYVDNNGEKITIEGLSNVFNPIYHNYSKLISGLLRHGMGVQYIISTIKSLNFKDDNINTWKNGVIRSLKVYMEDGEIKGESCPSCGGKIQRINGCKSCMNCGWSACS